MCHLSRVYERQAFREIATKRGGVATDGTCSRLRLLHRSHEEELAMRHCQCRLSVRRGSSAPGRATVCHDRQRCGGGGSPEEPPPPRTPRKHPRTEDGARRWPP